MDALLPEFFARDTETVARDLLGRVIVRDPVRMRIIETEAYLPDDTACHAFRGRTPRNAPMFGPPGRAYVYLVYGMHHLLNFVTEAEGRAAAVLIRGGLVLAGHDLVRERRGGRLDCLGPGKVGQALGLDTSWSGRALTGPLHVIAGIPATRIQRTPRIGIDYAAPADRDALWRYLLVE